MFPENNFLREKEILDNRYYPNTLRRGFEENKLSYNNILRNNMWDHSATGYIPTKYIP